MTKKKLHVRAEKMPSKVFYNLDHIVSPHTDPKELIIKGP